MGRHDLGLARYARAIEENPSVDGAATALDALTPNALRAGPLRHALSGAWVGHSLHPLLTDLPLGFWSSATALDLLAGRHARPAARRLVALGLLTALPTAASGLSDWTQIKGPVRRVGVAHAAANGTGLLLYAGSYRARRRGAWARATSLGVLGGLCAVVGGFLGGDLTLDRAVTRDNVLLPERDDTVAP